MENYLIVRTSNSKRCLVFINKITHILEDENGKAIIYFGTEKVYCSESYSEIMHKITL
ncbi:hypothetical protein D3C87_365340 [compost metagenome]|uniref:Uncharacterized protein n=1 Tax=Flavobacterium endophyticum TaxID=1540163 RepID=A0A495M580_9FLAO|nr:hypothetical protein CLV94_2741 [Flavobacterium endophyticum]